MRRVVASLSAVLMLAAVTAVAQEKVKDPPASSHAGMAKAGGAKSDSAVIAKATSAAPADIGRNAAVMGVGADGKMKELRAGTNGWMCMLDLVGESMCLDKEWQVWRRLDKQRGAAQAEDGRRAMHAQRQQRRQQHRSVRDQTDG